jgi:hypothetical protein
MSFAPRLPQVLISLQFESFKLGDANSSNNASINHHHARSRSRNLSVSSISSVFTSTNSVQPMTDMSPVSPTFPYSAPPSTPPATKRGSHHRRRSSVSTRHESADMMGVAVADLPLSLSDDNINLGDKDSVRRRALWALEGKSDNNDSFKVEIPDISTPEINKKFDLRMLHLSDPSCNSDFSHQRVKLLSPHLLSGPDIVVVSITSQANETPLANIWLPRPPPRNSSIPLWKRTRRKKTERTNTTTLW